MSTIEVVVGAQYGSEGKGAVCAKLSALTAADDYGPRVAVRVGGSQAGHTAVDADGRRWPLRHVPVAAVIDPKADLLIGPGSEIDLEVLDREIEQLHDAGHAVYHRLWVHPQATIIDPVHKATEAGVALTDRLGSTAKGVGAARAARVMRSARLYGQVDGPAKTLINCDMAGIYSQYDTIQIEGVQGYALGLHAGWYPFCTSSDCAAVDFLAMAGVAAPWTHDVQVWMAIRPNPIRVAGNSGPMRDETTWEDLGLEQERTTVTNKVRRVGGWDLDLVAAAAKANGAPRSPINGVLTMADHRWPDLAGRTEPLSWANDAWPTGLPPIVSDLSDVGVRVRFLGTGPDTMCEVTE